MKNNIPIINPKVTDERDIPKKSKKGNDLMFLIKLRLLIGSIPINFEIGPCVSPNIFPSISGINIATVDMAKEVVVLIVKRLIHPANIVTKTMDIQPTNRCQNVAIKKFIG